jgi:poly(3-hydroxybutyrate) depolymerase
MHSLKDHVYVNKSGVKIEISDESETQKGIYEITFSLSNPSLPSHTIVLGNSEVVIDNTQAIWRFFRKG